MSLAELVLYLLGVGVIGLGIGLLVQFRQDARTSAPDSSL